MESDGKDSNDSPLVWRYFYDPLIHGAETLKKPRNTGHFSSVNWNCRVLPLCLKMHIQCTEDPSPLNPINPG